MLTITSNILLSGTTLHSIYLGGLIIPFYQGEISEKLAKFPWVDERELDGQSIFKKWLTEGLKQNNLLKTFRSHRFEIRPTRSEWYFGPFMSLLAFDPKDGDEIIIPSFTFFGSASAAHFAGFKPVFCDVNPHTYMADLEDIKSKISSKQKLLCQ